MLKQIQVFGRGDTHQGEGRMIGRASFHTKEVHWVTRAEVEAIALPIAQAADCRKVAVSCGRQYFEFEF